MEVPIQIDGSDVTFLEFVSFVTDDLLEESTRFNPHWAPYSKLCHPCSIHYDYIIKLEETATNSFTNEIKEAWKKLYDKDEDFLTLRKNKADITTTKLVPFYMTQLSMEQLQKLCNIYKDDFKMFNYTWPCKDHSV